MAKKQDMSKTYIIIATIIGMAILGYSLIDNLYKTYRYNQRIENIENCEDEASREFRINWFGYCKEYGTDKDGIDCKIPQSKSDELNQSLKDEKDRCLKIWIK